MAGIGSGFVISPNQTLDPVRGAGPSGPAARAASCRPASGSGRRPGIAATGSVFFGALTSSRGDFGLAFRHGLFVIVGFVVLALLLAAVDVVTDTGKAKHAA